MIDVIAEAIAELQRAVVSRGELVGLAISPGIGLGLATMSGWQAGWPTPHPTDVVAKVEESLAPRWVVWSNETAATLVRDGLRLTRCWDLAGVQRLVYGGWRADPALIWAQLHNLSAKAMPSGAAPDLFSYVDRDAGDPEVPIRSDGYLRPEWAGGMWSESPQRLAVWAATAIEVASVQMRNMSARTLATAHSESAAELLCAELEADGLPMDTARLYDLLSELIGPRPVNEADVVAQRARRDSLVTSHLPLGVHVDLRSPAQVLTVLGRMGIVVPDTRASRLRELSGVHPIIEALLLWRKGERVATTYGYGWLDENLGADGRLRGRWTGCDGAAGRMTASAGLHNMPVEMRTAVVAGPGRVLVRADLGQIEPRVLAAVSGDQALARATSEEDLYLPVARELSVDRPTAKVAVLGAMYGQTTGRGAQALRGFNHAYPVAMAYLGAADRAGREGRDLRTFGGRLIRLSAPDGLEAEERSQSAARGRYARNAVVQGAAAELFKMWAVTVRARANVLDARIVLCLHDELLVEVAEHQAREAALLVDQCLQETARRWAPDDSVRFIADISILKSWSEAKS